MFRLVLIQSACLTRLATCLVGTLLGLVATSAAAQTVVDGDTIKLDGATCGYRRLTGEGNEE
jgi:hypothetical protein